MAYARPVVAHFEQESVAVAPGAQGDLHRPGLGVGGMANAVFDQRLQDQLRHQRLRDIVAAFLVRNRQAKDGARLDPVGERGN